VIAVDGREASMLEGVTASGAHWRMGAWIAREGADARSALALLRRRDIGRTWARTLVTDGLGVEWPGFAPDVPGRKPRLLGDGPIDISIAHSGTTLLVAVVADGLVGADIEAEPFDVFDRAALIRRMCSDRELASLERLPRAARRRALARAWTVKEATLKAHGIGLAADPRAVATTALDRLIDDADVGPERATVHLTESGGCAVSLPGRGDASQARRVRMSHATSGPFDWSG